MNVRHPMGVLHSFSIKMVFFVLMRRIQINGMRKSMDWFLYDNGLRHERVKIA